MKQSFAARSLMAVAAIAALTVAPAYAEPPRAADKLVERHLVQIEGGRRLNINCLGTGSPTVIFEQGLGAHILSWETVALAISSGTRACVYDRAGEGFSDPSGRAATAENVDQDLQALLKAAGINGPLVLVGHSIGGLYATLFADEHPSEIAGLVLVDPSFAGQNAWVASPKAIHNDEQEYRDEIGQLTQCITVTSAAPIGENNPRCPWSFSPQRTAVQKAYLGYAFGHPFKWAEERSELEMFHANGPELSEDGRQEERARRPFAQMPVIVLTAGKSPPLEAGQTPDELATEEEIWRKGHDALAARSLQGKSILVPEASHFIQIDRPDAVIAAIQEVVAKVRAKSAD